MARLLVIKGADEGKQFDLTEAAATIGRDAAAREAYGQAARLSPNSPEIAAPLHDLEARQARMRGLIGNAPGRSTEE